MGAISNKSDLKLIPAQTLCLFSHFAFYNQQRVRRSNACWFDVNKSAT